MHLHLRKQGCVAVAESRNCVKVSRTLLLNRSFEITEGFVFLIDSWKLCKIQWNQLRR